MSSSSRAYFSKVFPMRLIAVALLIPVLAVASDDPFDPFQRFNKPVSIGWWKAACKDAYVTNPERGYAKGYCHGVMLAYMNELNQWCVPDRISWGEVEDYIAMSLVEASIDPFSIMNIGEWIESAISVKWPCDDTVDNSVVTDPALIEKLKELSRQSEEQQQ